MSSRKPMTKLPFLGLAALVFASTASADPRETSPNDKSCANPSLPTMTVRVTGLKSGAGKVRVQAYGPGGATFLDKGKWVRRVDMPLNGRRSVEVCVPLPRPGQYAFVVRHDSNANRKSDWNDGGGFSRNPKLSLMGKPSFAQTAVSVPGGPATTNVVMNYRKGLSVRPIG
jgi:uncharacterized protein (DUF2141 family)